MLGALDSRVRSIHSQHKYSLFTAHQPSFKDLPNVDLSKPGWHQKKIVKESYSGGVNDVTSSEVRQGGVPFGYVSKPAMLGLSRADVNPALRPTIAPNFQAVNINDPSLKRGPYHPDIDQGARFIPLNYRPDQYRADAQNDRATQTGTQSSGVGPQQEAPSTNIPGSFPADASTVPDSGAGPSGGQPVPSEGSSGLSVTIPAAPEGGPLGEQFSTYRDTPASTTSGTTPGNTESPMSTDSVFPPSASSSEDDVSMSDASSPVFKVPSPRTQLQGYRDRHAQQDRTPPLSSTGSSAPPSSMSSSPSLSPQSSLAAQLRQAIADAEDLSEYSDSPSVRVQGDMQLPMEPLELPDPVVANDPRSASSSSSSDEENSCPICMNSYTTRGHRKRIVLHGNVQHVVCKQCAHQAQRADWRGRCPFCRADEAIPFALLDESPLSVSLTPPLSPAERVLLPPPSVSPPFGATNYNNFPPPITSPIMYPEVPPPYVPEPYFEQIPRISAIDTNIWQDPRAERHALRPSSSVASTIASGLGSGIGHLSSGAAAVGGLALTGLGHVAAGGAQTLDSLARATRNYINNRPLRIQIPPQSPRLSPRISPRVSPRHIVPPPIPPVFTPSPEEEEYMYNPLDFASPIDENAASSSTAPAPRQRQPRRKAKAPPRHPMTLRSSQDTGGPAQNTRSRKKKDRKGKKPLR